MEKHSFKKPFRLSIALSIVILFFAIGSCRKETFRQDVTAPGLLKNEIDLMSLKSIYSSDTSGNRLNAGTTMITNRNVNWDRLYYHKRDSSRVIEFNMQADNHLWTPGISPEKCLNKNSLIFLEFANGKRMHFYMKVFEDLTADNISMIKSVHYNSVPSTFNGQVMYYNSNRQFVNGYKYVKGRIIARIKNTVRTAGHTNEVLTSQKNSIMSGYWADFCYEDYIQVCLRTDGVLHDCAWEDNQTQTCYAMYIDYGTTQDTIDGDTDGGGGGGGGSSDQNCPVDTTSTPPPSDPSNPSGPIGDINSSNSLIKINGGNPVVLDITSPCPPKAPPLAIKTDTINRNYPCFTTKILNVLESIRGYNDLITPFETNAKPDVIWSDHPLDWHPNGGGQTMLGNAQRDPNSYAGLSSLITMNDNMLNNSSRLMIAAVAIHETIHAYIRFDLNYNNPYFQWNGNWFESLEVFMNVQGLPSNYRDHYEMLTDYFNRAISILALFDNQNHTQKEYAMAMLYGLDQSGTDATPDEQLELTNEYNLIKLKFGISPTDQNNFYIAQLNASTNDKLGCTHQ
ncbi:hypothetical protein BEL04_17670 [Mucilaginibacter sp. PPCGB 2223]|uniref:hypothetical protein n=1 Tax=Mucilaginibacter sp. PPCGB 2223 TaxID=1886027 RepID=UPI000825716F|nr:hypothetical protein [Mucilaginibacter sp. PPCGB 2223]OCX51839.1 hypothetical protein BEL04_17670 [Mucilaginibacter sp. PPCGB 2223]